ncbi:MAG: spore cortex biosynthesis protein YabQ [Lachnospiraceae bacterium]|nr:spore cortex biosynthesis protein YabQ [Lachnospiraceae bacterium]
MSQDIIQEVTFFLHSIVMGIVITFAYDWFLILRKLIRHNLFWLSFEDFLFWAACGLGVFYMLYRENNGVLRWFTVLGAMLGMFFYKLVISKPFIHIMSTCIYKIMWFLFRIIQIIVKPLKWLFSVIKRFAIFLKNKSRKCQNFIKNKLTGILKTLKIVLCKH